MKAMQDQLSEANLKVAILSVGIEEAREKVAQLEAQVAELASSSGDPEA